MVAARRSPVFGSQRTGSAHQLLWEYQGQPLAGFNGAADESGVRFLKVSTQNPYLYFDVTYSLFDSHFGRHDPLGLETLFSVTSQLKPTRSNKIRTTFHPK